VKFLVVKTSRDEVELRTNSDDDIITIKFKINKFKEFSASILLLNDSLQINKR
jgi:hypothetical protein